MILGVTGHRPDKLPGGYDLTDPRRAGLHARIASAMASALTLARFLVEKIAGGDIAARLNDIKLPEDAD